jgi:hypothetical protein
MIRYNTSTSSLEAYANGSWTVLAGAASGSYLPLAGGSMTGTILETSGSAASPSYSFVGNTGTGVYSSATDNLNFATGGAPRLAIDNNGYVGVGTTSPSAPLDVSSSATTETVALLLENQQASGAAEIQFKNNMGDGCEIWQEPTNAWPTRAALQERSSMVAIVSEVRPRSAHSTATRSRFSPTAAPVSQLTNWAMSASGLHRRAQNSRLIQLWVEQTLSSCMMEPTTQTRVSILPIPLVLHPI